ncbi:hypothetical protein GGR56DRAFT_674923 [Xylariaceae sp. FL0804]|nr:hypothetical protein GGR56DRAFT_674923 [Xylariaceae sp. FL0804]
MRASTLPVGLVPMLLLLGCLTGILALPNGFKRILGRGLSLDDSSHWCCHGLGQQLDEHSSFFFFFFSHICYWICVDRRPTIYGHVGSHFGVYPVFLNWYQLLGKLSHICYWICVDRRPTIHSHVGSHFGVYLVFLNWVRGCGHRKPFEHPRVELEQCTHRHDTICISELFESCTNAKQQPGRVIYERNFRDYGQYDLVVGGPPDIDPIIDIEQWNERAGTTKHQFHVYRSVSFVFSPFDKLTGWHQFLDRHVHLEQYFTLGKPDRTPFYDYIDDSVYCIEQQYGFQPLGIWDFCYGPWCLIKLVNGHAI